MEYGLWLSTGSYVAAAGGVVLILVLMEYGLWLRLRGLVRLSSTVLILVLMEYGLWLSIPKLN